MWPPLYIQRYANAFSRKPHERMIAQAESIEVILHVAFGRGIKWLSVPINDPNFAEAVQQGEKICVAALKCFIVSAVQVSTNRC